MPFCPLHNTQPVGISAIVPDHATITPIGTPAPYVSTADLTNAVVASVLLLLVILGVGPVGTPVNAGLAIGAYPDKLTFPNKDLTYAVVAIAVLPTALTFAVGAVGVPPNAGLELKILAILVLTKAVVATCVLLVVLAGVLENMKPLTWNDPVPKLPTFATPLTLNLIDPFASTYKLLDPFCK